MGPEDPPPLSAANRATLQKGISIKAGHHTHSQTQALQGLSQSDGLVPLWGGGQDGEEVISLAVLDWIQTAWWQPQELVNLRSTWQAGLEKSNHYPNLRMIIYYIFMCVCVCVYLQNAFFGVVTSLFGSWKNDEKCMSSIVWPIFHNLWSKTRRRSLHVGIKIVYPDN
jgi:hypothetical protein